MKWEGHVTHRKHKKYVQMLQNLRGRNILGNLYSDRRIILKNVRKQIEGRCRLH
jgi:hypothetical protein